MPDAFSIKFDASGLNAALDSLTDAATESVRPTAQAGAQVLYEQVKANAPTAKRPRKTKGGRIIEPGALKASIYQVYSKDNSTDERATYHVSWNYKKAPHGQLVEFGTSRAPAHPFLTPAFDSQAGNALKAAEAEFIKRMAPAIVKAEA